MMRVFIAAVVIWFGAAVYFAAHADPRKDIARDKVTSFCEAVRPPPPGLVEAVQLSYAAEPGKWASSMQWLQRLAEAYQRNGCGDA